jgi:hypothetical protein
MSSNRFSRCAFAIFALLTALVVVPFPVQAQEARRPVQRFQAVAFLGDDSLAGIWKFVVSLLPQGRSKEGMSIDPNGGSNRQGATPSTSKDEGPMIDPNGRQ